MGPLQALIQSEPRKTLWDFRAFGQHLDVIYACCGSWWFAVNTYGTLAQLGGTCMQFGRIVETSMLFALLLAGCGYSGSWQMSWSLQLVGAICAFKFR